jgi:hypothetical protein
MRGLGLVVAAAMILATRAEAQAAGAALVITRRISPAVVNPKVTRWTENHFVWLDSAKQGARIMLLLPGSTGRPGNFRSIGAVAAQQGYRAIGLMYPDDISVMGACRRDRDDDCMANMRHEVVTGAARSPHVQVDRDNSIDGRLADLLRKLAADFPAERWDQFLEEDGTPRWSRIAVGGLSQGGGHAAYIAKLRDVPRVVMFGSPTDGLRGDVAHWMRIGKTPADRHYGFRHERDRFESISPNWNALGMGRFGREMRIDAATTDFGGTHRFTTAVLPATGSWEQAHPSVFSDGATPRRPDGSPVFDAIWRYLLGSP